VFIFPDVFSFREIFEACLARPIEERAGYLDQVCAGDVDLRRRVEELLHSHSLAETFLEESPISVGAGQTIQLDVPLAEKVGDRIGRYKLLQQIGEGGCGLVYMAEQQEPVKRRVALKVIKLGMDTKNVIARFEAERQALALMDHPNIAKVLDAGATDKGRPYFVMELVRGVKITDYCDQNSLPTCERLLLFVQVCQAIQHAHQKGIIHRDIKPSNILVTLRDGVPVPKVIDFGIAKATTDQRLTDKTLFTAFEQFIGTPTYMSPEQAEMSELGIDTRSDIYSLGVLLYELLTGQTPFDSDLLLRSGLDETRRIIREQEPVRPSTRLSTMLAGELTTTAQRRQTEPAKLSGLIRGDLDWIVMKCLEKDRARRYETANGLGMDIRRHLQNEPVVASPPGNFYRLHKFAQRNKLAVAAGTFVAISVIVALCVATVALLLIKRAKDDPTEKLRVSYLAEAHATRSGGQAGQRFASLEAVQKAAAIRPDMEARNAAIACLAMPDLRVAKQITITGHAHNEHACFDLNLEQYAFADPNGNITIRAASNNLVLEVLSPSAGYSLQSVRAFSPDGKFLSAFYERDGEGESYWVWDLKEQKAVIRAPVQSNITNSTISLANDFSPDSRLFANSRADGCIAIFETSSGHEVFRHPGTRTFKRLGFNNGDALLACFGPEDPRVEIRDVASGRNLATLQCPGGVSAVAWSLDDKRLAIACPDFSVQVWDAETGQRQTVFEGSAGYVMSLAFNHAGNLLAGAGIDGKVWLWDADTGRQMAIHPGTSWQIQFSPDDRYLMGWQNLSRFGWLEVVANREYRQLYVPRDVGFISEPVFSPDGRILAAGGQNNIRFWDANSWQRLGYIHQPSCTEFVFNPDGRGFVGTDGVDGVRLRRPGPHGRARLFYLSTGKATSFVWRSAY
jgi:serine/threonine protein kinase/WD40 repeat protein